MKKVILSEIKKYQQQVSVAQSIGDKKMYSIAVKKLDRAEKAFDLELERESWGV